MYNDSEVFVACDRNLQVPTKRVTKRHPPWKKTLACLLDSQTNIRKSDLACILEVPVSTSRDWIKAHAAATATESETETEVLNLDDIPSYILNRLADQGIKLTKTKMENPEEEKPESAGASVPRETRKTELVAAGKSDEKEDEEEDEEEDEDENDEELAEQTDEESHEEIRTESFDLEKIYEEIPADFREYHLLNMIQQMKWRGEI